MGVSGIAEQGVSQVLQGGYNMVTSKVIGKTWKSTKVSKKGIKTEETTIAIQAWEIGALATGAGILIAGVGASEFLTGKNLKLLLQDSLLKQAQEIEQTPYSKIHFDWGQVLPDLSKIFKI